MFSGLRAYSAAYRSASADSSIIRRMSQTQRAHRGVQSAALKISTGLVAPASMADLTSRSRMPLQLQTYTGALRLDLMICSQMRTPLQLICNWKRVKPLPPPHSVIPGLVPGTHALSFCGAVRGRDDARSAQPAPRCSWVPGTRPGMTMVGVVHGWNAARTGVEHTPWTLCCCRACSLPSPSPGTSSSRASPSAWPAIWRCWKACG